MEKKMTLDDLKKESYLLVFMLNHEDSAMDPFTTRVDGLTFINYGGTKNASSLQSMLQALKRKNFVVNVFSGAWALTKKGKKEAEYWLKRCDRARVKPVFVDKEGSKDQPSLEEKLSLAEAELDGLRVEITMANHTNEYLDEQIQILREENSKLKEKIALIQKIVA